tara:strand:+ start:3461 stop:4522 length:1062 start_codon:yes stop_codon:yes gene_type:complete
MKKISISTGGSGGHVIPAQVLYDYLADKNDVIMTSDNRGLNYLDKNLYKTKEIDVPKLTKNILNFIPFVIFFTFSIIKSYFFLRQKKIKILISTGGYMSIPVCLAAKILKLKILLLEPNLVLGRANLFLLDYCDKIFTYSRNIKNLPKKMKYKNFVIKPLIRKDIILAKAKPEKKQAKFSILIIGGSQGAKKFDDLFKTDLIRLSKNFKIKLFHQTSNQNLDNLNNFYFKNNIKSQVFSYTTHLFKIIKKCDFVITRSGASTINELVFLEKPFLAIPFPFAKDDHQYYNAKYYVDKKLGWLIREDKVKQNFLYKFIRNLIKNKKLLSKKKKNMHNFHKRYNWNKNSKKLRMLI